MFSWIPIYIELGQAIIPYRNRQSELIQALADLDKKGLPIGSINDKEKSGKSIPLAEIDPFTFFATFNRGVTDDNRRKILAHIKTTLGLKSPVPNDFDGIPIVNSQAAWFFGYKPKRRDDDIPSLWNLAEAVVGGPPESLNASLYEKCLQIYSIGRAKLTMGMFWLNPKLYIAWDANNRKLFEKEGIENDIETWAGYLDLVKHVKEKLGSNFPEISRRAWAQGKGDPGDLFTITEAQLQKLWARFRQKMPDFKDFGSPGQQFVSEELDYKRKALSRYQLEIGNEQMRKWVDSGEGGKARDEISKRVQANFVAYQSWRISLGSENKQSSRILGAFLKAAERPYAGPSTIQPIIDATVTEGLKPLWDTLSTVLWALRPTDYFPIKISYYRNLAEELGQSLPAGPPTAEKFDELMQFGKAFREALAPQKPNDWIDVQSFIWTVCPRDVVTKQYWAGGHQWGDNSKLDEFINGNFWQIGWDKNETNPAAKKTWSFFEKVNIGDELAIKGYGGRNDLRVYYVGEVLQKNEDGSLKLRQLDRQLFRGKGPLGLNGASWFDTLIPITKPTIIDAIFNATDGPEEAQPDSEPKACTHVKNLILYGPPGTGKTYQTIDHAIQIIEPGFQGDRIARKKRFDELISAGRIEFITFHQSYSYEDFVEGIRPNLDVESDDGVARYECRPGTFKRLATDALFYCLNPTQQVAARVPFDALWNKLVAQIETDPDAKYAGLSAKTSYQLELTAHGNIEATNVISNKKFFCSRKLLEQVFEAKRQYDSVTVSEVMEVVARGCHSQLVAALFRELRRIEKSSSAAKQAGTPVANMPEQRADIVQRFLAKGPQSGYELRPESQCPRYVLVIDEINRGNISKILGELITLLEGDKRLSNENDNSLIVRLPYSGEKFAVPSNLYVLATMNSADKSIALVDVALRRRFDFEEVLVDLSVCGLSPEAESMVSELNRRLLLRKDRDHQIGHAYFMNVVDESSFNDCFQRKVIPLLQEYFYNDWEGLRFVLGEKGGSDGAFIMRVPGSEVPGAKTRWQWREEAVCGSMNFFEALQGNFSKVEA